MSSLGPDQNMSEPLENNDYRLYRLLDGYVFHIPEYQRFYSWSKPHWDDLWSDLLNIIGEDRDHYMGTIICKDEQKAIETEEYTANYREYGIVDGQQRFTTLVLLVKAIVSDYESINPEELSADARKRYEKLPIEDSKKLFVQDSTMGPTNEGYEVRNRLKLQQEDNRIFKEVLRDGTDTATISTPSQQRLVDAYQFYKDRLEQLREEQSSIEYLHQIGRLLSGIQSLQFMLYTIDNQAQATLIFESINDRGKGLSNLDKTKSFLMHKVYLTRSNDPSEVTINEVQMRFGEVYRSLQTIDTKDRTSGISEDRIQRYHYIATIDRSVNSKYIKSETGRRNYTLPSGATVYLEALKWHFSQLHNDADFGPYELYPRNCIDEIDWYTDGLKRYYSHMETIATYGDDEDHDSDLAWELTKLFSLGRLGNFYPLLLALWDEYNSNQLTYDELYEILQLIEVASFRIYSIAGRRSDTGESRFYRLANKIATDDKDADWIISKLKNNISSLEYEFTESLRDSNAYKRFRRKDIRYLFYSYDLHLRKEQKGGAAPTIEQAVGNAGNDYSIDHIRPNDTSKLDLNEIEEQQHGEIKHSLGNLTLTTGPRNAAWKNQPYTVKQERVQEDKPDYKNSDFLMTRELARKYETWGEDQINDHLDDIIEYAEKRWNLDADVREKYASIKPSEID
ncbi:DUF262 domain-containing protein [Natronorubrum daqingense]|uniref:DUF262 domain-containing protein n=1 Tax=Natronorubrum daqingense TaxID=588898 RepID=A0A1N6ZD89_9EURY|nr:DUF262 domain-containing protein [Natronorubrum daqingense]APX95383.1 hypothetical protein BB347_01450 [Natronorubrum daqingense]SIR24882.1 Protein of unknown function [Natronorubrum daqingense]